jgi:hypothetical protein
MLGRSFLVRIIFRTTFASGSVPRLAMAILTFPATAGLDGIDRAHDLSSSSSDASCATDDKRINWTEMVADTQAAI